MITVAILCCAEYDHGFSKNIAGTAGLRCVLSDFGELYIL